MTDPQVAPYGSWKSPITADLIASSAIRLGQIVLQGSAIYWSELRPSEGGRTVVVCRTPAGEMQDQTPPDFNVRTRVHEYGGGAFWVEAGTLFFSHDADQRLYQQKPGELPQPLTPAAQLRYADIILDASRNRLICVCEDHTNPEQEPVNTLISISLSDPQQQQILVSGSDFYASPRLSPDGSWLAWLSWDHPHMPWDGTQLWLAQIAADGSLLEAECVAGGESESIFQPEWSATGVLHFVSDRSGWWNLYRCRSQAGKRDLQPLCPMAAEFGEPQWIFRQSTYGFVAPEQILCIVTQRGVDHLAVLDTATGHLDPISTPYTNLSGIQVGAGHAVFLAGSATVAPAVVRIDLATRDLQTLRRSHDIPVDLGMIARAIELEFPTTGGRTAFGFFYPPTNSDFVAPAGALPPLLVKSHGGPTAATPSSLNLGIQYWTSRGFAVLDVNYGGSTGYGRAYRDRLKGNWGIVDVEDCVNGAQFLVDQGHVDPHRLAISGGSAGGFTTLCALTFHSLFKAGASYYGISDLEAMTLDTHKFESRYLDGLVGPYPERRDLYQQRSPLNFIDQLSCPIIFFQGLEDKVVPPNQSEQMVEALRNKGLAVAYVAFPGEQHGFRRAATIKQALDNEFYFYARIFGFDPADPVAAILIENL